jgi:hypothetical protein
MVAMIQRAVSIGLTVVGFFWLVVLVFRIWALLSPAPPHVDDPQYRVHPSDRGEIHRGR